MKRAPRQEISRTIAPASGGVKRAAAAARRRDERDNKDGDGQRRRETKFQASELFSRNCPYSLKRRIDTSGRRRDAHAERGGNICKDSAQGGRMPIRHFRKNSANYDRSYNKCWGHEDMKRELIVSVLILATSASPGLADEADKLRMELERANQKIAKLERQCALQAERIAKLAETVNDPNELDRIRRLAVHSADRNKCLNNLKNISAAKEFWAVQSNASPGAAVTMDDLAPRLARVDNLKCPGGGVYHVRNVGQLVRCSIHGPWPEKEDPNKPSHHTAESRAEARLPAAGER